MLEIILTILKYAVFGLVVLLLIVLALLLLVLLVPVRYELQGEKEKELTGTVKVHWLFHIVSFQTSYEKSEMKQILRILGVPVWKK